MGMLQLVTQRGVCLTHDGYVTTHDTEGVCLTHDGHVTIRDTEGSVSHTQWACYSS